MRVAHVAAEMVPLVKVGGLGDAVGALASALKSLGHQVKVFLPYYGGGEYASFPFARRLIPLRTMLAGSEVEVEVYEGRLGSGVEVCALGDRRLIQRGRPYVGEGDDPLRFGLFARAVAQFIAHEGDKYDLLHCHDWHAALTAFFLRRRWVAGTVGRGMPTVLTIHNIAYQGLCDREMVNILDLGWENFTLDGIEFYGRVNILKAGIISASAVTTVSPNYAKEILTPTCGAGLDGVLRVLAVPLRGVLNGIDTARWNPASDPALPVSFAAEGLAGKAACKADLQRELGLEVDSGATLAGLVSRLTHQKGIDLVLAAMPRMMKANVQLAILGEGEKEIEERLLDVAPLWQGRVSVRIGFDDPLAHRIYAGSDIFLVPSRFEPCGLSAMIAMRYGAVPVARATGGLVDSVVDVDRFLKTGSGFVFAGDNPLEFLGAVLRAASFHQRTFGEWTTLVKRIMSRDFSWGVSAKKYEALYKEVVIQHSR